MLIEIVFDNLIAVTHPNRITPRGFTQQFSATGPGQLEQRRAFHNERVRG